MSHFRTAFLLAVVLAASSNSAYADAGTGLTGLYYPSIDFSGTPVPRLDPTVNFNWGSSGPGVTGIGTTLFSVAWKGQVLAQFSETYTFTTISDDGVLLWVNGQLVINNWNDHAATTNSATIALVAGQKYDIVMKYYQNKGLAEAVLQWSSPSTPLAAIPQSALYPTSSTAALPLAITSPLTSRVSPAWLEGTEPEVAGPMLVIAGKSMFGVTRENPTHWYASAGAHDPLGIPLNPTSATNITVDAVVGTTLKTVSAQLQWLVTDLANLPYGFEKVYIRPGDQLLVAVSGPGTEVEIDTNNNGTTFSATHVGTPTSRFQISYPASGTYVIQGRRDGKDVGHITVTVLGVDFQGPIADQVGYQRIKDVTLTPAATAAAQVVFTANDPDWFLVSSQGGTTGTVRLNLLPLSLGNRVLQARIGTDQGPIIGQMKIDAFTLTTTATMYINVIETLPDGSQLAQAELEMDPLIPNLTINMWTFVSGVTFADSTTNKTFSTNFFTRSGAEGTYVYQLLRAPSGHANLCHAFVAYQNNVQISR